MRNAKKKTRRTNAGTGLQIAQFLVIGLILVVAYLGVQPYLKIILTLAPDPQDPVTVFLLQIPLVGWLVSSVGYLLCLVPAILFWGVVQIAELLPVLIETDRENIAFTVEQYRKATNGINLEAREEDPELIKDLVETFDQLPIAWLKTLYRYRTFAFLFDFVVTVLTYPPITVSAWQFATRPSFDDVNWLNLTISLACVFLIGESIKLFRHFGAGKVILTPNVE